MALLTDSSTNNFQLSAFGNTALNTTFFKFGSGSASFDGNGDYIRGNQPFGYSSNFTIEGWVYRTGVGSSEVNTVFEAGDIGPGIGGIHFYIDGDGTFALNNGFTADIEGGTATLNQWVHFAIVRNNNVNTLYINGTAVGSGTQTYSVTSNIFTIGGAPNYGFYFQGYLDDFRITSGIARYTSNFTPPAQQLPDPSDPYAANVSLLLHMNGADGSTTFTDSSTNNFTLTAFGNAQIDTAIKKFGSGAALFDGNGDYLEIAANSAFNFGTGDFTVEMWINPNASGSSQFARLIQCGDYPNGWQLVRGTTGVDNGTSNPIQLMLDFNGGSPRFEGGTLQNNQWSHVAITRQSGLVRVFVNGTLATSGTGTTNLQQYPIVIGANSNGNEGINAYIDELRITKGVARYTANFVPQTAPFAL